MLRKRTSFKPNLNQARAEAPAVPATNSAPAAIEAQASPDIAATHVEPPIPDVSIELATVTAPIVITEPATLNGLISESIPQDVTRLTGLRNSAYKNVKLKDLLFFNPPMTKDQKRHKKDERKRISKAETEDSHIIIEDEIGEPSLVPKVKLGPSGQLVLDESSTVISRKNSIKAQQAIVEDNEEIVSRTGYNSYRRKPTSTNQSKWSIEDTQKFFYALSIFGTDFSMMESLMFSGLRSRSELHKKFKREERVNKAKIDIALSRRITLDSEELKLVL